MFIDFHRISGFVSYSTPYVPSLAPMCCARASSEPIFNTASWMKSKLFSEHFVWTPPSFSKFPFFPSASLLASRGTKRPQTSQQSSIIQCAHKSCGLCTLTSLQIAFREGDRTNWSHLYLFVVMWFHQIGG